MVFIFNKSFQVWNNFTVNFKVYIWLWMEFWKINSFCVIELFTYCFYAYFLWTYTRKLFISSKLKCDLNEKNIIVLFVFCCYCICLLRFYVFSLKFYNWIYLCKNRQLKFKIRQRSYTNKIVCQKWHTLYQVLLTCDVFFY